MTSEVERLGALARMKLADLERRAAEGELPSTSELNSLRRLIAWVEGERQVRLPDTDAAGGRG